MSRELFNGLWLTEHRKSGKMIDKDSIMFSHPPFCQSRNVGVCSRCYSKKLSGYRPFLAGKQIQNTQILSSPGFEPCKLNTIDNTIRWGSFGELTDPVMYRNINRMAEYNPHLLHLLWTKRNGIVKSYHKAKNLKLVWSATKMDVQKPFVPDGYDIGFFVYTDESKIPKTWSDGHKMRNVMICNKECSKCKFCYSTYLGGVVAEVVR